MSDYFVYFGTYTGPKSKGIYVSRFSVATGKMGPVELAADTPNPTFLAIHPNHRFLYAVNETEEFEGKKSGGVSAFAIDRKTGKLTLLNAVPSGDPGACHVTLDNTGKFVMVANYNVGSVAVFPVLADGRLGKATAFVPHTGHGPDQSRQEAAHAHSIYPSPDNRFAIAADLGTDKVYVYRFDAAKGTLTPNDPPSVSVPPGSGPRHFTFGLGAKYAYVIEEMGSSLTAMSYDAERGAFHPIETISTIPPDYKAYNDCAELELHPNGKFLYGSNRGHNSVVVFALDAAKGTPTPVQWASTDGKTPRGFGIDPTGAFLIAGNQDSDTIVVFRIDKQTGHLTPTGQKLEAGAPVCVMYEPVE